MSHERQRAIFGTYWRYLRRRARPRTTHRRPRKNCKFLRRSVGRPSLEAFFGEIRESLLLCRGRSGQPPGLFRELSETRPDRGLAVLRRATGRECCAARAPRRISPRPFLSRVGSATWLGRRRKR